MRLRKRLNGAALPSMTPLGRNKDEVALGRTDASHSSSADHPRFRHPSTLLGFFRAVALPPTISFLWVSVSEEVCQHLLLPAAIRFDCGLRVSVSEEVCQHLLLPAAIRFDCGLSGITAYTSDLDQLRNPYFLVSFCVHFDG
ncbi:hypothetical protein ZIOFF_021910 [Zingiber officinale]|uniref:Uncharacterized protein n=1 Tax=Zingiber officinale TaxID=94328 RepID=A0A8J5LH67_ZINOF|nr:hypothetical protein ZIOFF_021910 [Zingiber officinale]